MKAIYTVLEEPIEVAQQLVVQAASEQRWAYRQIQSRPGFLVFTKGITPFSLGRRMSVYLEASAASTTGLTFAIKETLVIADFGRGSEAINKILTRLGIEAA